MNNKNESLESLALFAAYIIRIIKTYCRHYILRFVTKFLVYIYFSKCYVNLVVKYER